MSDIEWQYWKREGAQGLTELYRSPKNIIIPFDRFANMQRLREGFVWQGSGEDSGLKNDWATGWFDFDTDELTIMEVEAIIKEWRNSPKWPGRP